MAEGQENAIPDARLVLRGGPSPLPIEEHNSPVVIQPLSATLGQGAERRLLHHDVHNDDSVPESDMADEPAQQLPAGIAQIGQSTTEDEKNLTVQIPQEHSETYYQYLTGCVYSTTHHSPIKEYVMSSITTEINTYIQPSIQTISRSCGSFFISVMDSYNNCFVYDNYSTQGTGEEQS
uniref:Uncharacterized protein n=1 Tax=Amphimedon queenslandica TaxID=400682 RepID=A0A1X7UBL6_AMPQE